MLKVQKRVLSLGALSERWLRKDDVYRVMAVRRLSATGAYSKEMAQAMIDALFRELTALKLGRLLKAELGDPRALEGFVADRVRHGLVRASAPEVMTQLFSSTSPTAAIAGLMLGLLTGGLQAVKGSSENEGFLDIFIGSLKRHDPALAARCVLIGPRDRRSTHRWLARSQAVVVYGSDATIKELRTKIDAKTDLIAYGHRSSTSLYFKEALGQKGIRALARKTAWDIWQMDQQGCLSPSVVFVQKGSGAHPMAFAQALADELGRVNARAGHKGNTLERRVRIRALESRHQINKMKGRMSGFWKGVDGRWAFLADEKPAEPIAGFGQVFSVKIFASMTDLEPFFKDRGAEAQAVALECAPNRRKSLAEWLSSLGHNRITRAGRLQSPPVTWHHDGKKVLLPWLRWTDLEL